MQETLKYLRKDMERVEAVISDLLHFGDALMQEVGQYLSATKGKRMRPALTLLSARLNGAPSGCEAHDRVAASLEIVHLATLLHDDVIDRATTRRGKQAVNAKWGDDVAILMADHLFSSGFAIILEHGGAEAARALTAATCQMCEGEMFQIEKRDQLLSVEDYLKIIRGKTARLFSACSLIGALMAETPPRTQTAMSEFGMNFGMAFQIMDDLLDYTASGAKWGKQTGTDITNGKQTLPFIYAMDAASPEDRALLMRGLMNGGAGLEQIVECLTRYGAIERSRQEAREFARRSLAALDGLPGSDARDHLERLASFIMEREY
ncbi:MAG: polyprenyl synthetase family protein [Candidatus Sumerlaeota bacterium]|nr:polyprenyl synthetase family protein [Candidatus Sumerlaeota bacterium]